MRYCLPGLTRCVRLIALLILVGAPAGVLTPVCFGQAVSAGYIQDALEAGELVTEARRLAAEDDHRRAVERIQAAIDAYGQQLVPWDLTTGESTAYGRRYADTRWVLGQWVASDPELLNAYQQRFGPMTARLYAQAGGDRVALAEILRRYASTEAGLMAGLDLAAAAIETGDGHAATTRLAEVAWHPGRQVRGVHEARYQWLASAAKLLLGAEKPKATSLDGGSENLMGITGPVDAVPAAPLPLETPNDPLDDAAWRLALRQALARPVPTGLNQAKNRTARSQAIQTPTVSLTGRLAVVSTPTTLIGVDALAGRLLWRLPWVDPSGRSQTTERDFFVVFDMPAPKQVAVAHGTAVAAMGGSVLRRATKTVIPSELIALDIETGQRRWGVTPASLDPRLEDGAFSAAPLIQGQTVVATVLQQRGQQASTWLLGLSLVDGKLKWARLMSTLTLRGFNTQGTLAVSSAENGTVYLTDRIGHVAAVHAEDGLVRWLWRPTDEAQDRAMSVAWGNTNQGHGLAPVPLKNGGILLPRPRRQDGAAVVDQQTGQMRLSNVPEVSQVIVQASAAYYPVGGDLLVLGTGMARLDGQTLEPIWQRPWQDTSAGLRTNSKQMAAAMSTATVSGSGLWLTTQGKLWGFDLDNGGAVVQSIDAPWAKTAVGDDAPTRLAVQDGRVLAATDAGLFGHVDALWARSYLIKRLSDGLAGPEAAMSLVDLSLRAGSLEGVEESLSLAIKAMGDLQLGEQRSRWVMTWLRWLQSPHPTQGVADALFAGFESLVQYDDEQLALQWVRAEQAVREGKWQQAVDGLQACVAMVHASPAVARTSLGRQVRWAVERRLIPLIHTHGRPLYAAYDKDAQKLFKNLQSNQAEAQAYVGLIDLYPASVWVTDAWQAAASAWAQAGQADRAIATLRRTYAQRAGGGDDPVSAAAQLSALIGLNEQLNRADREIYWLQTAQRRFGNLRLMRRDESVPASEWLADARRRLTQQTLADRKAMQTRPPRVFDTAYRISGSRLPVVAKDSQEAAGFLIANQTNQLKWYETNNPKQAAWTVGWPSDEHATLLAADDEQLVLHNTSTQQLRWLDRQTGIDTRAALDLRPTLGSSTSPESTQMLTMPIASSTSMLGAVNGFNDKSSVLDGEVVGWYLGLVSQGRGDRSQVLAEAMARPLIVAASRWLILVADGTGQVAAIDRFDGRMLWRRRFQIDQMKWLEMDGDHIVLGGATGLGTAAPMGTMWVLDAWSGTELLGPVDQPGNPLHIGLAGEGMAAMITDKKLAGYRMLDGYEAWQLDAVARAIVSEVGAGEGLVWIAEPDRRSGAWFLRVLNAETGQAIPGAGVSGTLIIGKTGHVAATTDQPWSRLLLMTEFGGTAVNTAGSIGWRTATDSIENTWAGMATSGTQAALVGQSKLGSDMNLLLIDTITGRVQDEVIVGDWGHTPVFTSHAPSWTTDFSGGTLSTQWDENTTLIVTTRPASAPASDAPATAP